MATVYPGLGDWLARSAAIDLEPELDAVAEKVEAAAVFLAAPHVDTGEFAHSLHRKVDRASPSGRDRLVYSDDPAALSIEYGHTVQSTDGTPHFVDGQHILGRAADAVT